jgi:peptide/nickel transport system ATP-binding protein
MHAGRVVEVSDVPGFFTNAIHPYSRNLLRAAAAARDERHAVMGALLGSGGSAARNACTFEARCPIALPACRESTPALQAVGTERWVRCHRRAEVLAGEVDV